MRSCCVLAVCALKGCETRSCASGCWRSVTGCYTLNMSARDLASIYCVGARSSCASTVANVRLPALNVVLPPLRAYLHGNVGA